MIFVLEINRIMMHLHWETNADKYRINMTQILRLFRSNTVQISSKETFARTNVEQILSLPWIANAVYPFNPLLETCLTIEFAASKENISATNTLLFSEFSVIESPASFFKTH